MMFKQGDGRTGKIVESAQGNESGVCKECGGIFDDKELSASICSACRKKDDPSFVADDEASVEEKTETEIEAEEET